MLTDTSRWLEGDLEAARILQPHPRTGATPLHVASAKGYIRVMSMLVQGGADLNAQDLDGWTPLHAAAHWGQREACQLLCENMADMEIRNYVVSQLLSSSSLFPIRPSLRTVCFHAGFRVFPPPAFRVRHVLTWRIRTSSDCWRSARSGRPSSSGSARKSTTTGGMPRKRRPRIGRDLIKDGLGALLKRILTK